MCIHICIYIYIYIHGTPPETYLFDIFIRWLGQKGVTVPYIHAKGIIYIYIYIYYIYSNSVISMLLRLIELNFNDSILGRMHSECILCILGRMHSECILC